jgi:D-cysteine desulfhydrase
MPPEKLSLARLPTPLWRHDALDALVGTEVWVKRDDMSAGPEAGNKIRKLEYLLAEALQRDASTVITCGGFQSNHARATAILARQVELRPALLLRTAEPNPQPNRGNAFLDVLVGAEIRTIPPERYPHRMALMEAWAAELTAAGERAYVIPEGGSSALGALGYVDAMRELRAQLDAGEGGAPASFDAVVHACGSGGTAAGVVVGSGRFAIAPRVLSVAVCDDRSYFEPLIQRLVEGALELLEGSAGDAAALEVDDRWKGPGYGVASAEQLRFIIAVGRACGLVLDPVYTGKALFGLSRMPDKPARVLFIHTGGLPGLLAQSDDFSAHL